MNLHLHPKVEDWIEDLGLYNRGVSRMYICPDTENGHATMAVLEFGVFDDSAPEGVAEYLVYVDDWGRAFYAPAPAAWTPGLPPGTVSDHKPTNL